AFGKPSAESSLPRRRTISIASRISFESESDIPRSNEVQRSESHAQPQQHAEKERAPPHLFHCGAGDPAADEEQCRRESETSESEKRLIERCERQKIGIDDGGENKERDEPR